MAAKHGKAASVVVGTSTMVLTNGWTANLTNDLAEKTNHGSSGNKEFTGGLEGGTATISGFADLSGTGQSDILTALQGGTSVTLKLYEDDTKYITGSAFCSGIDVSAPVDDLVSLTANMTFSGAISRA